MRRLALNLVLCILFAAATANAQAIFGTYTMSPGPGKPPITLVLNKDPQGKVGGSLSGNGVAYTVLAEMQGDGVMGSLNGGGMRSYFEARRDATQLHVIMADMGADGKPDYAKAREFVMTPAGASGTASAAPERGNPLAGGGSASADPYIGTFASTDMKLTLKKDGAAYSGAINYRGTDYPANAHTAGDALAGTFKVGVQNFDINIASAGGGKFVNLTTGGTTYMLARTDAGGGNTNPLAGGGAASAAPSSALAKTPQDQQIVQVLTSTAWCSFSYSGGKTYTGGSAGTTRTSRAVFRPDGTASEASGSETVNTGAPGAAWGNNSNAKQGRWRVENAMLMLSADGMQWAPTVMKIEPNSNGYPILTVAGKEYMVCK